MVSEHMTERDGHALDEHMLGVGMTGASSTGDYLAGEPIRVCHRGLA